MSRYEYVDPHGDKLRFHPVTTDEGGPAVEVCTNGAPPWITPDHVEEVVAGIRDMARQAGGSGPVPRRRLTELEHDRAWHAIEATAGEDSADPGTVLNAVLHALGIDPPTGPAVAQPTTVHLDLGAAADATVRDMIRRTLGPGAAGAGA